MPEKRAVLYRVVMQDHVCPFGLKTRYLLRNAGYEVDDHWLTSRAEMDEFLQREEVDTTPQVWIKGKRLGGYDNGGWHPGRSVHPVGDIPGFLGGIGIVSVIKAVYLEKRQLTCACVCGGSQVPLGALQ